MLAKKSSEIQEIFGLSRDQIRTLEKEGVIKPEKNGQGKASLYGYEDVNLLLDIKLYLLAGYRIVDMKNIIKDNFDYEEAITEQLHILKKRLQMLEFIRIIRKDFKKLEQLDARQLVNVGKVAAKKSQMPEFGTEEYFDKLLDLLKLVFIVDFLSQRSSFVVDSKVVLSRTLDAYRILDTIIQTQDEDFHTDDISLIDIFSEIANTSDQGIQGMVNEIVDECRKNKDDILKDFTRTSITPITDELDKETGIVYRDMMLHLFQFAIDYFVDKDELYCIFTNIRHFVNGLNPEALANGVVRIGGKR